MGTLTSQAEQALLGAMLSDPDLALTLGNVRPDDFLLPQHRQLYTALVRAARDWDGEAAWLTAADPDTGPDLPPGYLGELEAACPDPAHASAYAALVVEAGFQRALLAAAEESTGQAAFIGQNAYRLRQAGSTAAFGAAALASHAAHVAHAVREQAAAFRPDRQHALAAPSSPVTDAQGQDEELVLGALVGGRADAGRVLAVIGPGAFGDPLRRGLFTAVLAAYNAGHAIDLVTVDWEAGRQVAWQQAGILTTASGKPGYAARLAETAAADEAEAIATALRLAGRRSQGTRTAYVTVTMSGRPPGRSPQAPARPAVPAPVTSPGLIPKPPDVPGNGQAPGPRR
jgi:hypothetical protein